MFKWLTFNLIIKIMKINFANQLRGLAAILVVVSHYLLVYFVQNGIIASVIGSEKINEIPGAALMIAKFCLKYINTGPVGVSIFFIISGFVISFSLKKLSVKGFLTQRFFRIFPTYWLSILIGVIFVLISCFYWNRDFWAVFNPRDYFINAALLNTILNVPMIDFVNWTLAIEVKFYILSAIVFMVIKTSVKRLQFFAFFQASIAFLYWAGVSGTLNLKPSFLMILSESKHMALMFIGLAIYNFMNKEIKLRLLTMMMTIYIIGFYLIIYVDNDDNVARVLSVNYGIGLMVFTISFFFRRRFKNNVVLDYMAKISYPLYLIHGVAGYVTISILYQEGCGYVLSIIAALSLSLLMASAIHRYVECPVNKFGKRLTSNNH